jgi:hypothetical protein
MNLLTDEIKNTRFLITLSMLAIIVFGICGIMGIALIVAIKGLVLDQIFITLLTTLFGAILTAFPLCINWYFKERENKDKLESGG